MFSFLKKSPPIPAAPPPTPPPPAPPPSIELSSDDRSQAYWQQRESFLSSLIRWANVELGIAAHKARHSQTPNPRTTPRRSK